MSGRDAGFGVTSGPAVEERRIGVIGCGRIGRMHASILAREIPGFVLVAVADVVPAAAESVAAATGAQVRSIDEIFTSDDIDTVAICTSTDTHVDMIERAAAAGARFPANATPRPLRKPLPSVADRCGADGRAPAPDRHAPGPSRPAAGRGTHRRRRTGRMPFCP